MSNIINYDEYIDEKIYELEHSTADIDYEAAMDYWIQNLMGGKPTCGPIDKYNERMYEKYIASIEKTINIKNRICK